MMKMIRRFAVFSLLLILSGCAGIPDGVKAVEDFKVDRYLGKWYEIARLDHPFERGLTHITAEYSLREDGKIRVMNRGYNTSERAWKQAEGKADFVGDSNTGRLKVSFFGPFYGGYNIVELDPDYQYSLVVGNNLKYLWILARENRLDQDVLERLKSKAVEIGFSVDELIWVNHADRPSD